MITPERVMQSDLKAFPFKGIPLKLARRYGKTSQSIVRMIKNGNQIVLEEVAKEANKILDGKAKKLETA